MKKPFKLSLNQKPRLRLSKENELKDVTNQKSLENKGLKKTDLDLPKIEQMPKMVKSDSVPQKSPIKFVSIKNIEDMQDHQLHQIFSKKAIMHLEPDLQRASRAVTISKKIKAKSSIQQKESNNYLQNITWIDEYRQYFPKLQQSLKHENYITHFHTTLFMTLKNERFYEIVVKIIKVLIGSHNHHHVKRNDPFSHAILAIKEHHQRLQRTESEDKNRIVSSTISYQHSSKEYWKEVLQKLNKVEDLNKIIKKLQLQITKTQELLRHENQVYAYKLDQINKIERKKYQMENFIAEAQSKLKDIESKYQTVKFNLDQADQKYQYLKNFINTQQKSTILKSVVAEFKEIESEMFDYAVYLQSNQLANDVNYEPRPFTEIQNQITEELKSIILRINQNVDELSMQKCHQMKSFITESMRKFRNKDKEMLKVCQFRANCIINFVKIMKRWLNNWQLKQEYLNNLKKQFAALTIVFKNKIKDIVPKMVQNSQSDKEKESAADVLRTFQRLQEIFFYGNSFY